MQYYLDDGESHYSDSCWLRAITGGTDLNLSPGRLGGMFPWEGGRLVLHEGSIPGARWRKKSGAIIASPGEKSGLEFLAQGSTAVNNKSIAK